MIVRMTKEQAAFQPWRDVMTEAELDLLAAWNGHCNREGVDPKSNDEMARLQRLFDESQERYFEQFVVKA